MQPATRVIDPLEHARKRIAALSGLEALLAKYNASAESTTQRLSPLEAEAAALHAGARAPRDQHAPVSKPVPHHLRRRATAHKRFAMPVALRVRGRGSTRRGPGRARIGNAARPLVQQPRVHLRQRPLLERVWSLQRAAAIRALTAGPSTGGSGGGSLTPAPAPAVRLVTHMWHVKRLRMMTLSVPATAADGSDSVVESRVQRFVLPFARGDVSVAAVLRWLRQGGDRASATAAAAAAAAAKDDTEKHRHKHKQQQPVRGATLVHDESYVLPLVLSGTTQSLLAVMLRVTDPSLCVADPPADDEGEAEAEEEGAADAEEAAADATMTSAARGAEPGEKLSRSARARQRRAAARRRWRGTCTSVAVAAAAAASESTSAAAPAAASAAAATTLYAPTALCGHAALSLMLHAPDAFPSAPLAPATALWLPSADGVVLRQLVLWVHAAAAASVAAALHRCCAGAASGVRLQQLAAPLCRFQLVGHGVPATVSALTQRSGGTTTGISYLTFTPGGNCGSAGAGADTATAHALAAALFRCADTADGEAAATDTASIPAEGSAVADDGSVMLLPLSGRKRSREAADATASASASALPAAAAAAAAAEGPQAPQHPMLLLLHAASVPCATVIVPEAAGKEVWHRLLRVRAGAGRVVGQREWAAVGTELTLLSVLSAATGEAGAMLQFPRDYPDTAAGAAFWRDTAAVLVHRHMHHTAVSRTHVPFPQATAVSPFAPAWRLLWPPGSFAVPDQLPLVIRGRQYAAAFFSTTAAAEVAVAEAVAAGPAAATTAGAATAGGSSDWCVSAEQLCQQLPQYWRIPQVCPAPTLLQCALRLVGRGVPLPASSSRAYDSAAAAAAQHAAAALEIFLPTAEDAAAWRAHVTAFRHRGKTAAGASGAATAAGPAVRYWPGVAPDPLQSAAQYAAPQLLHTVRDYDDWLCSMHWPALCSDAPAATAAESAAATAAAATAARSLLPIRQLIGWCTSAHHSERIARGVAVACVRAEAVTAVVAAGLYWQSSGGSATAGSRCGGSGSGTADGEAEEEDEEEEEDGDDSAAVKVMVLVKAPTSLVYRPALLSML